MVDYVRAMGYPAAYTGPGRLNKDLAGAAAIIMPQPSKRFAVEDLQAVRSFILRGGGMLYLCDHTNVGGCMTPANELLAPYGIRLNFDTALPAVPGWWADLVARDYPPMQGLNNDRCGFGWWVGASLKLEPEATPLLVGTRCWSDRGNMRNAVRAYLGDYRVNRRERVGDLVLAAAGNTGNTGRVVVFGDTSTPQNVAVAQAWDFVSQTVAWITARQEWRGWVWMRLLGFLAMVVGFVSLRLFSFRPLPLCGLAAFIVAAGLMPHGFAGLQLRASPGREIVPVYAPALGRYSLESMKENGLWGSLMAIERAGKLPRIVDHIDARQLYLSRHILMLSPGAPLPSRDRELLSGWVARGGQLVISCAPDDWHSMSRMSVCSGADVTYHSLGSGPAIDSGGNTRYGCSAYALRIDRSVWTPVLIRLNECFAAVSQRGRGRVVLLADPAFLTCRNTEGEVSAHTENSRWLSGLFHTASVRRPAK